MIILSHRGYWKKEEEKNTRQAFERSFSSGFGAETDIRDYHGQLVISHDVAQDSCISLEEFFKIYNAYDAKLPLALNIKSDGLQGLLKDLMAAHKIENYFVFDMSAPDTQVYKKYGMRFFTRHSEHETEPIFYKEAEGVWLDEFDAHWITKETLEHHLRHHKKVCIVSPELHGRPYENVWEEYRQMTRKDFSTDIMLCTDYPQKAKEFFYG